MGGQSFTYEYIDLIFENLLLQNHLARKAEICVKAPLDSVESSLFK